MPRSVSLERSRETESHRFEPLLSHADEPPAAAQVAPEVEAQARAIRQNFRQDAQERRRAAEGLDAERRRVAAEARGLGSQRPLEEEGVALARRVDEYGGGCGGIGRADGGGGGFG